MALLWSCAGQPAVGQEIRDIVTTGNSAARGSSAYAPDAMSGWLPAGRPKIEASAELDLGFDSNVTASTPTGSGRGARSDFFASLLPSLGLDFEGANSAFTLRADGEFRQYKDLSNESFNNGSIAGRGQIDFGPAARLFAAGSFQLLHEDRGALVPLSGRTPTQFNVTSGRTGIVIDPSPVGLRLHAMAASYGYNSNALANGTTLVETGRDHVTYMIEPRLTYRIVPQYSAFLRAVVNRRQYTHTRLADGLNRDSSGYAADVGLALDLPGFAEGEIYAGYVRQDYDQFGAKGIGAPDFGAVLRWHPTAATTMQFDVTRSIEESALLGARGYLQTAMRLGVEYRVLPYLEFSGGFRYLNIDFMGRPGETDLYEASLAARYLLPRGWSAGLEYDFRHRGGIASLPAYNRQIIALRLRGQL